LCTFTPIKNQIQPCKTHFDIWFLVHTDGAPFNIGPKEFYDTKWLAIEEAEKIVIDQANKNALEILKKIVKARGFDKETISELFMLFMEECGELAKAARATQPIKSGAHSKRHELAHEAADVFIYLIEICNYFGVNLEDAFREKEKINAKRIWK